jgi:pimeloyl-ACP methyl ester carboxylesterase
MPDASKIRRALVETPTGMMHYRYCGEGKPLLLMHQTSDSSREFLPLMPLLAPSYKVIALDTVGYGDSDPAPQPLTMGGYADSVADFMTAIDVESAAIVGNHTGAGIAVELAAREPGRVTAIVANGLTLWDEAERSRVLKVVNQSITPRADGSHLLEFWKKAHYTTEPPLEIVQRGFEDFIRAADFQSAYGAVFGYDMASRLPLVECPLLVVVGKEDPLSNYAADAAALAQRGEPMILDGVKFHLAELHTARYAEIILEFLARN